MRLFIIILILFSTFATAQANDPWIAFWDDQRDLRGYKDQNGKVRIEPKFMGLTSANKFKNIIAVMEEQNGEYVSYYLLKNGKKVGLNSTYVSDMRFDCESENTIRFRDPTSDKVGYFDASGNIAIPPSYSDASPFRNGMAVVLKNAKRICWEGGEFSKDNNCEHWSWKGGSSLLIDKKNNILVDNFEYNPYLDWYSLQISDIASENPQVASFRGRNGKYYNFVDIKKDFKIWILNTLLNNLSKEKLIENTSKEVTYWKESNGWIRKGRADFISLNYKLLENELHLIENPDASYFIFMDGLNPFIYDSEEYRAYFDDCGEPKTWKYPVLDLTIERKRKDDDYQNSFEFLKTEKGYRLISVTIRTGELK